MTTANTQEKPVSKSIWSKREASNIFISELGVDNNAAMELSNMLEFRITDQDYDLEGIADDLSEDSHDSEFVNLIADHLKWSTDAQKEQIFRSLKLLFCIEIPVVPEVLNFKWNVNKSQMKETREYMAMQCPSLIKDGEDEDMIYTMAIGKINNMKHLLCYLYDAYTVYRNDGMDPNADINHNNGGKQKTAEDFIRETILRNLPPNAQNLIAAAMDSFDHRLLPGFKFEPARIYVDKCSVFIDYTIMVSKALRNLIENAAVHLSLQVDLVIIPRKIIEIKDDLYDIDSTDDDEDGENEEAKVEYINDDLKGSGELDQVFEKVFKERYKQKYSKTEIENSAVHALRNLTSILETFMLKKNGQRISIVIDRRTTPDTMYIFTVPENDTFSTDYCLTTLVYMSVRYVLPVWNKTIEKAEKYPFVGGGHTAGKLFIVSFQVMSENQIRMQWNFVGNGIHLTPKMMVNLWPRIFVGSSLPEKYDEQFIEKEMNANDPYFDAWKKQLFTTQQN